MTPIRIACTGAGYFSRFHYEAWQRIENVAIVGALALSSEDAASTGYPPFVDLAEMIEETRPDILDIITPPPTHLGFIRTAIEKGVRTIICQKPFCNNIEEAKLAIALAEQSDTTIVVHENFRFQPWYRCIKQAIDQGLIGELHQLTFRMRTGDGQGPDAYLERQPYFQSMPRFLIHETGVHWIDTFRYLMGEPIAVYADLRKMNPVITGEDAGYVIVEFEGNKRAILDGNRHLDHAAQNHRLTFGEGLVEGTTGTLELAGDGSVRHRQFMETETETLLPTQNWQGFAGDCVFELQKHVIQAMSSDSQLENTAQAYMKVLEVEAAVYQSAQTRQRVEIS